MSKMQTSFSHVKTLGFGFSILFTAYSTSQRVSTIVRGESGIFSLGILYIVYAISCFFAPQLIQKIGIKQTLVLSSIIYTIHIFASLIKTKILYSLSSAVVGFFGSMLWISQGLYISALSQGNKDVTGRFTGTFYGIHKSSAIVGYCLTQVLFSLSLNEKYVTIIFGLIGICSTVIFMRLPEVKFVKHHNGLSQIMKTFKMYTSWKMQLFFLQAAYQGHYLAFISGEFSKMVGLKKVSAVFICYGSTMMLGSFLWGKLYDKSWKYLITLQIIFCFLSNAFCYHVVMFYRENVILLMISGILFGITEGILTNLYQSSMIQLFPEDRASAMAFCRFISAMTRALSYFYTLFLGFAGMQVVTLLFMIFASLCYIRLRTQISRKNMNHVE